MRHELDAHQASLVRVCLGVVFAVGLTTAAGAQQWNYDSPYVPKPRVQLPLTDADIDRQERLRAGTDDRLDASKAEMKFFEDRFPDGPPNANFSGTIDRQGLRLRLRW